MLRLNRRNFLKLVAAMGASAFLTTYKSEIVRALEEVKDYWHICWLNGASCTGCTVSFMQSADPDLLQILTEIMVGTSGLPIAFPDYMETLHPASGTLAEELKEKWFKAKTKKILIVEGSVQEEGYCVIGGKDFREHLKECAKVADAIIAVGQCATFGGIPAAKPWNGEPNPTNAIGVQEFLYEEGINKDVINIPCCPAHPDHILVTIVSVMLDIHMELDMYNRPKVFFGKNMHNELCTYRPYYDRGIFVTKPGEEGCRFKMGCKGPMVNTDCAVRKWNMTSYCVDVGICIGCSEPGWPDKFSPFYSEVTEMPRILDFDVTMIGQAILGATIAGIAVHGIRHVLSKKKEEKEER